MEAEFDNCCTVYEVFASINYSLAKQIYIHVMNLQWYCPGYPGAPSGYAGFVPGAVNGGAIKRKQFQK